MTSLMRLMLSVVCLAPVAAWAQPAKVTQETTLHRGADGDVTGRLTAGTELQVLSRVTTESGTWCRVQGQTSQGVAAGSVPCRALAISQPEPTRVVMAQPLLPPPGKAAVKKPAKPKAAAPPPDLLLAPTAAEMGKIVTHLGKVTATQPVDELNPVILQEYKFSDNPDAGVVLWVRPTGQSLGAASHEITSLLSGTMTKVQRELLPDGRRLRIGKTPEGLMVTALAPAGDYEWTLVYVTSDGFDDAQGQVLDVARKVDNLLFYQ
jgi:hypothetical protein